MKHNSLLNEIDDSLGTKAEKVAEGTAAGKLKTLKSAKENEKDEAVKLNDANKKAELAKKDYAAAVENRKKEEKAVKEGPNVVPSVEAADIIAMFSKELGIDPSKIDKNSDRYYQNGKIKKNMVDIDDILTENSVIFEDFHDPESGKRIVYAILAFYKNEPNEDIVYEQIKDDLFVSIFISFDLSLKNCYTRSRSNLDFLRINLLSESKISYVKMFIAFLPLANQQWLSEVCTNNLDLQKINDESIDSDLFLDTLKKLNELNYSNVIVSEFFTNLFKLIGQEMKDDYKAYLMFNGTLIDYNTLENKRLIQTLTTNAVPISNSINFFTNNYC